ncbi:cyclopropane-fatty-acyl-phospholipid synthase [Thalassobaculum fulvum]|uniref:Cyclopropane-fatty-acyl-phospholipid synthase n=1 Tax=Thalassobaculum fulvum TaxID=1633335 RepID=A0A919CMH6_9PROT|nr:cyclopropane-fatty-acyl-phospholipid synthase family protein [Thalassobaculum fulvum]GHD40468.1 cyclopropane-fatty-acyl-phospholipid synthase [Thalassobaculum fulvum]
MRPILATSSGEYPIPQEPQASTQRWDGLDRWTRAAFRLLSGIAVGRLTVVLADGRAARFEGPLEGPEATLRLRDPGAVRRFMLGGDLAFAEAYMDGAVDCPDPAALVELYVRNQDALGRTALGGLAQTLLRRVRHWFNANTRRGSRRNIAYHYDLGNAFYRRWLDPSMTYSAARFRDPGQSLEAAQEAKYRQLADMLDLRPGQRVLEIGCGWGGFAEVAARDYGVEVLGVTLSREQHAYAVERIAKAGLADRVTFEIRDYRDVEGSFDRIASIEMFEAVGERYWSRFFGLLRDRLAGGGRAALQVITIAEERFAGYRASPDFIQRYIFPGGMLPTRRHLHDLGAAHGLRVAGEDRFGLDYARTLAEWRERFLAEWPAIEPLGFDDRFRRMWEYYLAYCEGGFRGGQIDVCQIAYARN